MSVIPTWDEMVRAIRQWFTDHPEEAKREIAIVLRTNDAASTIEKAAALAERAYANVCEIQFGNAYGAGKAEPQIDTVVIWKRAGRRIMRTPLLAGIDEKGNAYMVAGEGDYDKRTGARAEFHTAFSATMQA